MPFALGGGSPDGTVSRRIAPVLENQCEDEVIQRVMSPDSLHEALLSHRDCGAVGGAARHISLISPGAARQAELRDFVVISDREQAGPNEPWVRPRIKIAWLSRDTLLITTQSRRWRKHAPIRFGRVNVMFQPLDAAY